MNRYGTFSDRLFEAVYRLLEQKLICTLNIDHLVDGLVSSFEILSRFTDVHVLRTFVWIC